MIDRRTFLGALAGSFLTVPLGAELGPGKVWRIGALDAADSRGWAGFREGLRDLGWEDGRGVVVEFRWSSGQAEHYQELAAELARISVDVLVTGNWEATRAAKQATSTIPIVMLAVTDPPAAGFVGRFDRPTGNVTGVSYRSAALATESVEILRELRPGTSRVALLYDSRVWASSVGRQRLGVVAARAGLDLLPLTVSNRQDLDTAFAALTLERPDVLIVDAVGSLWEDPNAVPQFAIEHGFPTISGSCSLTDAGLLMSYGPALFTMGRRAAGYVNQILKGAKPGDLHVEQPTKFELVINLKTAKALGLTIPPSLLQRADQVIE